MLRTKVRELISRYVSGKQSPSHLQPFIQTLPETRVQRDRTLGEAFFELVEKYGLMGKVDLNVQTYGYSHHFRLIAILPNARRKWITTRIVETGTSDFFPPGFVKEARILTASCQEALGRRNQVTFEIHPAGMTLKEIQEEQAAWAAHCEAMWGNS